MVPKRYSCGLGRSRAASLADVPKELVPLIVLGDREASIST